MAMAVSNMFINEPSCNGIQECSGPIVFTWIICKNIYYWSMYLLKMQQQRKTVLDKLFIYPVSI